MIAGGKIKESVEIYEEGSNEQLSRTIRDFKNFANTYDLFTEVSEAFINPLEPKMLIVPPGDDQQKFFVP